MIVGDWAFALHEGTKITGYVTGINSGQVDLFVTNPKGYGPVTMPVSEVGIHGAPVVWPDDIPAMIDLSLMIRDEDWFRHWMYELSLWKPIESFMSRR
ncbi:hypothetical protein [Paenibacillus phocaensis]|uniref:hypothetical protein n=1 Tax=Paenibacillus phocaensis TaxID=1776378 RepID=UPI000839BB6B|nr:hypothetical protein [Paenibacillus phocaensis]